MRYVGSCPDRRADRRKDPVADRSGQGKGRRRSGRLCRPRASRQGREQRRDLPLVGSDPANGSQMATSSWSRTAHEGQSQASRGLRRGARSGNCSCGRPTIAGALSASGVRHNSDCLRRRFDPDLEFVQKLGVRLDMREKQQRRIVQASHRPGSVTRSSAFSADEGAADIAALRQ